VEVYVLEEPIPGRYGIMQMAIILRFVPQQQLGPEASRRPAHHIW